ncbi:MAG TPA: serine hydrolase domain-containing protein [Gaiellales bacterium]
MTGSLDALAERLDRRLAEAQRRDRVPALSAAVAAGGEQTWSRAIGLADVDAGRGVTPDDQFRIGSITKVVTAICVMQLRDEGVLDLDDALSDHLPAPQRGPTIRRMLSHLSGLQREPVGDVWATMQLPSMDDLVEMLPNAELVLRPGEQWHYSNLAFGLLGAIVQEKRGRPYPEVIRERVLDPLGMHRTTWLPEHPHAVGYLVDPYADTVRVEEPIFSEGFGPSGQLWSTPADLLRLGGFLAAPSDDVLRAATVDEMHRLQSMFDEEWTLGWGLGVALYRSGDRFASGHDGAMPGFLAALMVDRKRRLAVAALGNSGARNDPHALASGLLDDARELVPEGHEAWRPGDPPPSELAGVLGRWWSEGEEFVFSHRDGKLHARWAGSSEDSPPAVFQADGPDRYRGISGRERGELLAVLRDGSGRVRELRWAGYPFTRDAAVFGASDDARPGQPT